MMLGILYLLLALGLGGAVCTLLAPRFAYLLKARSLCGGDRRPSGWMVFLPAVFFTGIVLAGWLTYLAALAFAKTGVPMRYGTGIAMTLCGVAILLFALLRRRYIAERFHAFSLRSFLRENRGGLVLLALALLFWGGLMIRSFYVKGTTLWVGDSVFSDFCPHLAVIRSFARGENLPTSYPHFADGTIRYHFLFQFVTGTLEYLGLRIDLAFNLLSILSMLACVSLLYSLALQVTGRVAAARLAVLLFTFRSSFAVFTYFLGEESFFSALFGLFSMREHIGNTPCENWGLWTQKVYLNQRHLALSLSVALFVLMAFYPMLVSMTDRLLALRREKKKTRRAPSAFHAFALDAEAWLPRDAGAAVALGILLGATGFFNGAVLIATLCVLFCMALCSRERLSYLITACIAVGMTLLESRLFIPGGSAVAPALTVGFLAPDASLGGILAYLIELLGLLPLLALLCALLLPKGARWLTLAFASPILLAELLQLTPDVTVNHKYIMFACMLLDVPVAALLCRLADKGAWRRALAAVLTVLLTLTGLCDLITLCSIDNVHFPYDDKDPLTVFVSEETPTGSLFLTDNRETINGILLGGRLLFDGWPYFAWSAGYDVDARDLLTAEIYSAPDAETAARLCRDNGIDFVYISDENRTAEAYSLHEEIFREGFALLFSDGDRQIYGVPSESSK